MSKIPTPMTWRPRNWPKGSHLGSALIVAGLVGNTLGLRPAAAQSASSPTANASTTIRLGPVLVTGAQAMRDAQRPYGPGKGYVATRSQSGTKTNTSIVDTPQTINVVTQAEIAAQQAQTVSQALRYTPGISDEIYGFDTRGDWLQIRGFNGYDSQYLDGLKTDNGSFVYSLEPYGLDRLEVLKGPASMLYGANEPGGLINAISKRPTDTTQNEVELQTGSYGRKQGAFDVSGPVQGTDGTVEYRLVGLERQTDTQVNETEDNRQYLAPSITWKPDSNTSLTLLLSYERVRLPGWADTYLPAEGTLYSNPNGKIPTDTFLGFTSTDHYNYDTTSIGYELTHRFNNIFSVAQNFRYSNLNGSELLEYPIALEANGSTVERVPFGFSDNMNSVVLDNHVEADFTTGPVSHKILVGLDYRHFDQAYSYLYGNTSTIDIYDPDNSGSVGPLTVSESNEEILDQIGNYVQDQMTYGPWRLTTGVRHDQVSDSTDNLLTSDTTSQNEGAWTTRSGLVYLFKNGLAPYVSYATSFEPVSGTDAENNPFKPTRGTQYEAGVKYKPPGVNALLTAAAYNLTETNVQTANPQNPLYSVQTGEDRSRGVELEAKATLFTGFDADVAYAYTNAVITKDNSGDVGNLMPLVAENTASIWLHYALQNGTLRGLGLAAGTRYRGSVYGDTANDFQMPAVTLVDLAMDYDLSHLAPALQGAALQLNATNIADTVYVATCESALACFYGTRRTVLATLKYSW